MWSPHGQQQQLSAACAGLGAVQGVLSLAAILLYVLAYACGSGPIPWVYLPEILPDDIQGRAAALCTSGNWAANLVMLVQQSLCTPSGSKISC